jgi:hypothetical protein
MGKEETELQRQIMDYLDAKGIYYVRPQAGGYRGGMNLKCNEGAPDLVVCVPREIKYSQIGNGIVFNYTKILSLFYGIEIKTTEGKQRPSQKLAQERIERCGGKYLIVRSLAELQEAGI